jgi:hypothetical protein
MNRPIKLNSQSDQIELDRVTILIAYFQRAFESTFGDSPDINEWDAVRIRLELSQIFEPNVFDNLFETEFGKGIIVGAWVQEFILTQQLEDRDDDLSEEDV